MDRIAKEEEWDQNDDHTTSMMTITKRRRRIECTRSTSTLEGGIHENKSQEKKNGVSAMRSSPPLTCSHSFSSCSAMSSSSSRKKSSWRRKMATTSSLFPLILLQLHCFTLDFGCCNGSRVSSRISSPSFIARTTGSSSCEYFLFFEKKLTLIHYKNGCETWNDLMTDRQEDDQRLDDQRLDDQRPLIFLSVGHFSLISLFLVVFVSSEKDKKETKSSMIHVRNLYPTSLSNLLDWLLELLRVRFHLSILMTPIMIMMTLSLNLIFSPNCFPLLLFDPTLCLNSSLGMELDSFSFSFSCLRFTLCFGSNGSLYLSP